MKDFAMRHLKKIWDCILGLVLLGCSVFLVIKVWSPNIWTYEDIIDAFRTSVTILVSMLGFSVSIYVFLNTTLQGRRSRNVVEKEIIIKFQKKKQKELCKRLIFSVFVVLSQSLIIVFKTSVIDWCKNQKIVKQQNICLGLFFVVLFITIFNIVLMVKFTHGIIDYENGLKILAIAERNKRINDNYYEKMNKGEFLNIVNNIEVLVERLVQNHMHAKTSNAYDSNLKRSICDGITEAGDISLREELANDYNEVIEYRNLLLQDESLMDSQEVGMGDTIKSVMQRLFEHYLKSELLTGVSISNLSIFNADLSKTSFCNSSFRKIVLQGNTNLYSTDFTNSVLNDVSFGNANCENINFTDTKLIDIKFDTAMRLERAVFIRADFSSIKVLGPEDKEGKPIKFDYANFDYANLTHIDIYNISFDYARMSNARFINSTLGKSAQKRFNITFKYSDMTKSNLLKCNIEQCDFQNANLEQAVFTHAQMKIVNLCECKLEETNFTESIIMECKFDKAYCRNISFKEARISDSSFTYATLNYADLSGGILKRVRFDDSVCRESLWVRTSISHSQFARCVFAGARIVGEYPNKTLIKFCDFSFSNFNDTAITNIEFENCNFYGADFSNARLINVRFTDCENIDTILCVNTWLSKIEYYGNNTGKLTAPVDGWRYSDDKLKQKKASKKGKS